MCREWIWEYVLKHCSNNGLIRALAEAYPVPDSSLHLKRMLLLKSLSFNLSEDQFSDRTLETISLLLVLYHSEGRPDQFHVPATTSDGYKTGVPFTLQDLHLAVRVECAVRHLRRETDNWPKFYEALEKHWGEYADDTQEPEHDVEFGRKFLQLKEELWNVQKQPELRHDLLKRHKRGFVKRLMQSFLSDAWEDVGSGFLEGVAEDLKKGLYVPDRFSPIDAPSTKKGLYVADGSSPGKPIQASIAKDLNKELHGSSPERPIDASMAMNLTKGLCMPRISSSERSIDASMAQDSTKGRSVLLGSSSERPIDASTAKNLAKGCSVPYDSSPLRPIDASITKDLSKGSSPGRFIDASLTKDLKKGFYLPDGPSVERPIDAFMDPRTFLDPQLQSKRKIPATLQENSTMTNASSPSHQKLLNSIHAGKSSKGEYLADLKEESLAHPNLHTKVFRVMPTEQRDECVATQMKSSLHEEEPAYPSPPPWAGSPGLNGTITLRSKRRKLGPFYPDESDPIKTVAAVGGNAVLNTPEILKAQLELKEGQESLHAVVKDPLPEAMKIAEEAAKAREFVRKVPDLALLVKGGNQGVQSLSQTNNNTINRVPSSHLEGVAQVRQEKPSKRSIMDRNPTAQTIEWETSDDIDNSSDDKSPSHSRQIHLPRLQPRQSFTQPGGVFARNQPRRRKFRRWTQAEENILRKEVGRYGKGQWKHILQKHSEIFESRTEVDLKDKWRNIERREGIL